MKKIFTWLWLAVALVNVGVGIIIRHTCAFMTKTYVDLLGGQALPVVTERVLAAPWWPYGVSVLALIAAVVSGLVEARKDTTLVVLVGILLVEIIALSLTAFGLCLPMYIPLKVLAP